METQARISFIIARCIAAAIAFYATERHPYSFYIFSRWVVFLTCCWGVFFCRPRFWQLTAPLYGIVGIIFNPLIPFHFTRGTWHDLDVASGLILLATIPFTLQSENTDKITRESESVSQSSLVEQPESESFMNKKRVAREWLYLLGGAIAGLVIVPLLGVCISALCELVPGVESPFSSGWGPAADFYNTLFRGIGSTGYSTDDSWIFLARLGALVPYLLFQFLRSVIWAWKTAFPSSQPSVSNEKTKAQKERWKLWPILTVISLIGAGVVILASISSQTAKMSQQADQAGGVPVSTNQSPQTDEASDLISNQNSNVNVRKAIPVGTNPYDQFDAATPTQTAPAQSASSQSNPFDQFDSPASTTAASSSSRQSNPYAQFVPAQDQPAATAAPTPNVNPFTIGSSMKDVSDVMGLPDSLEKSDLQVQMVNFKIVRRYTHAIWHYGNSIVTFENGKVTKYNNVSGNLRVRLNTE